MAVTRAGAQKSPADRKPDDAMASVPKLAPLIGRPTSDLVAVVERFTADQQSLTRRYDANDSPEQRHRMRSFAGAWRARLREIDFDRLNQEGRADYVLLDNQLKHQIAVLDRDDRKRSETAPLLPFSDRLLALQDARRDLVPVDPAAAARTIAQVAHAVDSMRVLFEPAPNARGAATDSAAKPRAAAPKVSRTVANRAADNIDQVRGIVAGWYRYYDGYDPQFTWWVKSPHARLDSALTRYARTLRERVVGIPAAVLAANTGRGGGAAASSRAGAGPSNDGPIIGDPIGAEGLKEDLEHEMIPYTPEELIAIAEREYAFSLSEVKKAARDMGLGDDWKAAMEKVKDTYVEPGKQPEMIRALARQAEDYFDAHDWVTIPPLAREDWRMEMLSPERQKVSPFFLGGESILVSYPTADMTDEDKLMSLRGNNPHFSHATVFHELNPGHHLQGFMQARYNAHRRIFSTPFWSEGQSLYWEMFLWDHGFHATPEDRVGALFWRMHRSARIIFSLNFHLGKMTPDQAVQFLVDTVGFERANAEGEVRRSFNGTYSPLYQAGYMLGGLQLRALHHELVDSGKMTDRAFHDAVLEGGAMPIAMVRARLEKLPITRDGIAPWRFAEQLPPPKPWAR
ncbi:MAG: DUF885 domain-containing protein [Gemmatimonadota bacterium]|nr:DUF885 domain-containing protein [Gemmatimonadota bacterium]